MRFVKGQKPKHAFKKGQSGNPSGRPKVIKTVIEIARARTEDAMKTLGNIMDDPEAPHSARVAAAQALLDRGWGKAAQIIEATVKETLTIEQIDMRLRALVLGVAVAPSDPPQLEHDPDPEP